MNTFLVCTGLQAAMLDPRNHLVLHDKLKDLWQNCTDFSNTKERRCWILDIRYFVFGGNLISPIFWLLWLWQKIREEKQDWVTIGSRPFLKNLNPWLKKMLPNQNGPKRTESLKKMLAIYFLTEPKPIETWFFSTRVSSN